MVDDYIIGPYMLPDRLDGHAYLVFLRDVLPDLMRDVPQEITHNMIYQLDGAPAHFARACRIYLDQTYIGQWIGRGGPFPWPARSPDLTPLDFCIWGHVKDLVYETPVENQEELVARIILAFDDLKAKPGISKNIRRNMRKRCNLCIEQGGRQFQQFL